MLTFFFIAQHLRVLIANPRLAGHQLCAKLAACLARSGANIVKLAPLATHCAAYFLQRNSNKAHWTLPFFFYILYFTFSQVLPTAVTSWPESDNERETGEPVDKDKFRSSAQFVVPPP